MIRPVYEFRPLPDFFGGKFRRYAEGSWIPDDGEYDIAFVSDGYGPPICLYVGHGYQKNIVSGWLNGHWREKESRHPRSNPWHYALTDGESEWGGDWGRDKHKNTLAGDSGMSWLCKRNGCANGRSVSMTEPSDKHVSAGLVRDRETKDVFRPPIGRCMYCGDSSDHLIPALAKDDPT